MMTTLSRYAVAIAILTAVAFGYMVYRSTEAARTFNTAKAALTDSLKAADSLVKDSKARRVQDSTTMTQQADSLGRLNQRIASLLTMNAVLRDSAAKLLMMQDASPLIPSVPGQPATVGDTLRQCRSQIALCSERAALEKQRADSLALLLTHTGMQVNSLRESVETWKHNAQIEHSTLEYTERQLQGARSLLAKAAPPCKGLPFVGCPSRTDAALWASALTIFVIAEKKEQKAVGVSLLLASFVW